MKRRSLRRDLTVSLLGLLTLIGIAGSVWVYFDARHEVRELLKAQMVESANLLLVQASHEIRELGEEEDEDEERTHWIPHHRYERELFFQIWDEDFLLYRSDPNVPEKRWIEGANPGEFYETQVAGKPWIVYVQDGGRRRHRVELQIAAPQGAADELAARAALRILLPLLLLLPITGLAVGWRVRRSLNPLDELGRQMEKRGAGNLAPVDPVQYPEELEPTVGALNSLLERLKNALEAAARFTGDAAHELRTPLAGIRTQAQVALGAQSDEERRRSLVNVIEGVDRLAHLASQLLQLERLEPELLAASLEGNPISVAPIAREVLSAVAEEALAKKIELSLEGELYLPKGSPHLLVILLRNLVENAIRYSPSGTGVEVVLGSGWLEVRDRGPGIPEAERARVFDRFYRIANTEGVSGSGLGLSIVKRIADLHGAQVSLRSRKDTGTDGAGLAARVDFRDEEPTP